MAVKYNKNFFILSRRKWEEKNRTRNLLFSVMKKNVWKRISSFSTLTSALHLCSQSHEGTSKRKRKIIFIVSELKGNGKSGRCRYFFIVSRLNVHRSIKWWQPSLWHRVSVCGMRMMIIFIEFSDAIAATKRESLFSRNDNDGVQKWLRTTISDENYYNYGVHWNARIILGARKFARGFLCLIEEEVNCW